MANLTNHGLASDTPRVVDWWICGISDLTSTFDHQCSISSICSLPGMIYVKSRIIVTLKFRRISCREYCQACFVLVVMVVIITVFTKSVSKVRYHPLHWSNSQLKFLYE